MDEFNNILTFYPIQRQHFNIKPFGDGLINNTYLVGNKNTKYILQKINTAVFQDPEVIASNLQIATDYIKKHNPTFLFLSPLKTIDKKTFVVYKKEYWRLSNFVEGSVSINTVSTADEAFEAAKAFARLTKNLNGISVEKFSHTIPSFHDLSLRFQQFEKAIITSDDTRKEKSKALTINYLSQLKIVTRYEKLLQNKDIPIRIMHHDTKINNALFDRKTKKAITVCDLDTLMPGYIISDIGDMFRTYLSPVTEDSTEFEKIMIRGAIYEAIKTAYLTELKDVLTGAEKNHLDYGGEFMIYMQGIRFLTDYLNNDVYYPVKYAEHNHDRAMNQWVLLSEFQRFINGS